MAGASAVVEFDDHGVEGFVLLEADLHEGTTSSARRRLEPEAANKMARVRQKVFHGTNGSACAVTEMAGPSVRMGKPSDCAGRGEEIAYGRAAFQVAERDGLGEGKTEGGTGEMSDGPRRIAGSKELEARGEERRRVTGGGAGGDESGELAIDVADAFETRDDFLADVAALVIIDVGAVEAGLGREGVLTEFTAPAREAGFDAQDFEEFGGEERPAGEQGGGLGDGNEEVESATQGEAAGEVGGGNPPPRREAEARRVSAVSCAAGRRWSRARESVTSSRAASSEMM